jgi:LexA-binding, inner membrane-associated putative hydrolase
MASVFSHAVAALGIGACFYRPGTPKRVWVAGALCSVIPDLDVVGFHFGIHYGDFWGHRGFTHSLLLAALLASLVVLVGFRQGVPGLGRFAQWSYLFLATASHGLLDAMTDGGLGVAFISPFKQHPLLSSVETHSSLPHWHRPLFQSSRPSGHTKRTSLDLASDGAAPALGLAHTSASSAVIRAAVVTENCGVPTQWPLALPLLDRGKNGWLSIPRWESHLTSFR